VWLPLSITSSGALPRGGGNQRLDFGFGFRGPRGRHREARRRDGFVGDDAARMRRQDNDAVGERDGLFDVMRDQQRRHLARLDQRYLVDEAVANNTLIKVAVQLGATRIIVLPTGFCCALDMPPRSTIAVAMHAITLLIARQLVSDFESIGGAVEIITVPPLLMIFHNRQS
jgi:hypothetical protein